MRGIVVGCLALLLSGCFEVDSAARIDVTGGGRFTETVTIDLAALAAARKAFRERTADVGEDEDALRLDPFGVLDPKQRLAALRAAEGIDEVTSEEVEAPEGKRRYVLRGRFRDLRAYFERGPVDALEAALWSVRKDKALRLEAWSLYDDKERDPASRRRLNEFRRSLLAPFTKMLAGLEIRRSLVFPTPVLESNGTIAEDRRTVTWTLDAMQAADPASLRQVVVFQRSPQLKIATFGTQPTKPEPPTASRPAGKGR